MLVQHMHQHVMVSALSCENIVVQMFDFQQALACAENSAGIRCLLCWKLRFDGNCCMPNYMCLLGADRKHRVVQVDGTQSMEEVFKSIDKHLTKLAESGSHALAA